MDNLINELYSYVEKENHGNQLTERENRRYCEIVDTLRNNNIEIPFGIVI